MLTLSLKNIFQVLKKNKIKNMSDNIIKEIQEDAQKETFSIPTTGSIKNKKNAKKNSLLSKNINYIVETFCSPDVNSGIDIEKMINQHLKNGYKLINVFPSINTAQPLSLLAEKNYSQNSKNIIETTVFFIFSNE